MSSLFVRAGRLALLCCAPKSFSPQPGDDDILLDLVGLALLAAPLPLLLAARRLSGVPPKAALGFAVAADLALLYGAHAAESAGETLLAGYYVAAPFVWATLAATAATLADRYLGISFKNKRLGAAILVLAIGIFTFKDASSFIASSDAQWRAVVARDPANVMGLALAEPQLREEAPKLERAVDACLAKNPDACLCRTWRAEIELDRDAAAAAAADARAGMACAETEMRARAALAVALVRLGDVDGAREQIQATTSTDPPHPRGELAAALLARSTGDVAAARDAAAKAIASAGYLDPWPKRDPKRAAAFVDHSPYRSVVRDAHMVEAMVAIDQKQLDDARQILAGVLHDAPDDAEAVYDVALIEDLEGHFNPAREGYLRALKLRPSLSAARYNLALLTLRFGVMEEARHHAQAFKRDFPGDPRAADLELRIQSLPQ